MRTFFTIGVISFVVGALIWGSYNHGALEVRNSALPQRDVSKAFDAQASTSFDIVSQVEWHPGPDQNEYHTTKYGYVIFYPKELAVEEFPGDSNSMTLTFKDGAQRIGFQIFTIPYPYEKISNERFHMDVPSGVMKDPVNITINGAAATAFTSRNDAMGETWEVWFLHGGYLYEVTTPLPLKEWMLAILETWHFISK